MDDRTEKLLQRFAKAKGRKTNWSTLYEDALCYAAPQRNSFNDSEIGEEKSGRGVVYDSTALKALQFFASNLQSSLVPPMKKWVRLVPGQQLGESKETEKALEDITEVMFSKIRNSNFDTQVAETFLDLAVGTGALLVQKGSDGKSLHFCNVPLDEIFLEEGPNNRIDTAFRCSKMAARNIPKTWPDANLSKDIQEIIDEQPDKQIEIVEMTVPEEIEILDRQSREMVPVKGFVYYVLINNGAEKDILVERQTRTSPWVIPRWSSMPGEIYGRGPLLTALPDIKTLNKTKELLLKNASIAVTGMWQADDDGVINVTNITLEPGTIIPKAMGSKGLQPLEMPGRVDLAQIIIEDLKTHINDIMFAQPLGDVNLPVKTATEVSLRQQELAKRIGSAFGKLQYEFIAPLVQRILDLLDEMELIDLGAFRVDGDIIAIEHMSPLALAQDEEDILRMIRYVETIVTLFGPEMAMGLVHADKFSTQLAQKMNIPADIVPSAKEFEQMKAAIAQQAQAQTQQGMAA